MCNPHGLRLSNARCWPRCWQTSKRRVTWARRGTPGSGSATGPACCPWSALTQPLRRVCTSTCWTALMRMACGECPRSFPHTGCQATADRAVKCRLLSVLTALTPVACKAGSKCGSLGYKVHVSASVLALYCTLEPVLSCCPCAKLIQAGQGMPVSVSCMCYSLLWPCGRFVV